ncbi:DUF397 domain-containing protein [Streptomyces sp. NPDC001401]|uniref:DUF397 domain-containing protein n=1 Tax=Streptomyces sp. NPDC001401 TaxID=3364570 RepID=UPI0036A27554
MPALTWQKSSYCPEGNSCIHVAATPQTIHITETSDPTRAVLTTTPDAFATLLTALKNEPHPSTPALQVTTGEQDTVRFRNGTTTVTTDRLKWHAFVRGVQAGEFDHFVEDLQGV